MRTIVGVIQYISNTRVIALPDASNGFNKEAFRSYENQSHRASGLNLLVAAIILWNTTYLESSSNPGV